MPPLPPGVLDVIVAAAAGQVLWDGLAELCWSRPGRRQAPNGRASVRKGAGRRNRLQSRKGAARRCAGLASRAPRTDGSADILGTRPYESTGRAGSGPLKLQKFFDEPQTALHREDSARDVQYMEVVGKSTPRLAAAVAESARDPSRTRESLSSQVEKYLDEARAADLLIKTGLIDLGTRSGVCKMFYALGAHRRVTSSRSCGLFGLVPSSCEGAGQRRPQENWRRR